MVFSSVFVPDPKIIAPGISHFLYNFPWSVVHLYLEIRLDFGIQILPIGTEIKRAGHRQWSRTIKTRQSLLVFHFNYPVRQPSKLFIEAPMEDKRPVNDFPTSEHFVSYIQSGGLESLPAGHLIIFMIMYRAEVEKLVFGIGSDCLF